MPTCFHGTVILELSVTNLQISGQRKESLLVLKWHESWRVSHQNVRRTHSIYVVIVSLEAFFSHDKLC